MIDPTALTEAVLGMGSLVAAYVVPLVLTRRKAGGDADASSWAALNEALQREVKRLQDDLARQRADHQSQLDAARGRIGELELEVAALQRALRGGTL
jgi:polyhydroxyalkanoate synthesis regulator phasin